MKNIKLILFLLVSTSIMACQPQVTKEIVHEPSPAGPSGKNNPQGGVDDVGGGTGVNGKPLESYAVNVLKDELFKSHVLPIIRNVFANHPRFASDMVHISNGRTWYLLDVRLDKLGSDIIGVHFADESLQQIALQNLSAVWIDSKTFGNLQTDDDRAKLILHEIIMGIRLMQYKHGLDKCYSGVAYGALDVTYSPTVENKKQYSALRDKCAADYIFDKNDGLIPGYNNIKLSKQDYDNVRSLVLRLWDTGGEVSKVEIDAFLKATGFRQY